LHDAPNTSFGEGPALVGQADDLPGQPVSAPGPKPDIENDTPLPGHVTFKGCDWVGYDTTGDGCPNWFYCPRTHKLLPGHVDGCGDATNGPPNGVGSGTGNPRLHGGPSPVGPPWIDALERALDFAYPDEFSFPPPDGLAATDLFEVFSVVFPDSDPATPDEISSNFVWHVDPMTLSGTADVILHLTTDHTLIAPEWYNITWSETFVVDDPGDGLPGYMSVRTFGDLRAVLAWAADMGPPSSRSTIRRTEPASMTS